jgi:cytosine/adenosine deaminase-related metal-dependent hydrolase
LPADASRSGRIDALVLARPGVEPAQANAAIEWDDGVITRVGPSNAAPSGLAVLPGFANAHDHGRGVRASSFGAHDRALELWIPSLLLHPALSPYLVAALAHARLARAGYGAVAHLHAIQNQADFDSEAAEVARAVREVGLRTAFIIPLRDRNRLGYGDDDAVLAYAPPAMREAMRARFAAPVMPVAEQIARVERIAASIETPLLSVQFGPAGPQWCSDALLRALAERSAASGRRVHMHLLETRYQREWADAQYPRGILAHLDALSLLSERLTVAHGAWLTAEECALLAARGVTLSLNASSNFRLRSGTARIGPMRASGLRLGIGGDSTPLDDVDDAFQQMRLTGLVHAGVGVDTQMTTAELYRAASADGQFAVTGRRDLGVLAPGAPADFVALDWAKLADDVIEGVIEPEELIGARARAEHVRRVVVDGRTIVEDGQVTGVDLPALEADLRARLRALGEGVRAALPLTRAFQDSLAKFYQAEGHCRF